MGKRRKTSKKDDVSVQEKRPTSAVISRRGLRTTGDVAKMMSAVICEMLEGRVTAADTNAVANASGKILKAAELRMKYGTTVNGVEHVLEVYESE